MKKFLLSSLLVLGTLSGCQQVESVEQADETAVGFQAITTDVLTRSGGKTLDVVSLCADSEQSFSVFNLLKDKRSWKNYVNGSVNFYAHYPQLPNSENLEAEREVIGGEELLFATAQAESCVQSVTLKFQSVVAPVYVKIMKEDGSYTKPKFAKTKVANKGKQNLKTGLIKVEKSASKEEISFQLNEEGELVAYLLPQEIEAGTEISVVLASEEAVTSTLSRGIVIDKDVKYEIILTGNQLEDAIIAPIVDPVIPL